MPAAWALATAAADVADPAGPPGIEALVAEAFPVGPGLDGEADELGHGRIVVEHLGEGPVLRPDDAPLAFDLERLLLEGRIEPPLDGDLGHDGDALEPQVPLDVLVRPAGARQALVVPDGDRLVPVAELHVGDAVRRLPMKDPVESLPDGHGRGPHLTKKRAAKPNPRLNRGEGEAGPPPRPPVSLKTRRRLY